MQAKRHQSPQSRQLAAKLTLPLDQLRRDLLACECVTVNRQPAGR